MKTVDYTVSISAVAYKQQPSSAKYNLKKIKPSLKKKKTIDKKILN